MNTQVIEFLTNNPNSTRTQVGEHLQMRGLPLFNLLKQMVKDGQIVSTGEGNETAYLVADVGNETSTEQPHVETVNEEQHVEELKTTNESQIIEQPIAIGEPSTTETIVISNKNEVVDTRDKLKEPAISKTTERDNSKFLFNGIEMNKGQLVRSVVAQYVADNAGTTFKKLKEVFPDTLLKRFGIFQDEERAREISGKKYDRYFFKEEHVIKLKDKNIVVTNQWTAENLKPFLEVAKQLGYEIK